MAGSAELRVAVMDALTYRCGHTRPPVDGECGDCATLRDEIVQAIQAAEDAESERMERKVPRD